MMPGSPCSLRAGWAAALSRLDHAAPWAFRVASTFAFVVSPAIPDVIMVWTGPNCWHSVVAAAVLTGLGAADPAVLWLGDPPLLQPASTPARTMAGRIRRNDLDIDILYAHLASRKKRLPCHPGRRDYEPMELDEPPRLVPPSTAVRESWLTAERAACAAGGSTEVLEEALADFDRFVSRRQGLVLSWDVPCTFLWWTAGGHYLGELVIRHELTPALLKSGGHIGYEVALSWRRRGHGTAMLAAGLAQCGRLGLHRVLLTIDADNEASRRVCLANGGVLENRADGEDRFWITIGSGSA